MSRNKGTPTDSQVYGADFVLHLGESLLGDTGRLEAVLADLANQGFRSVWLTVRDSGREVLDAAVSAAFRVAIHAGRRNGIGVWLGVGLNQAVGTFAQRHPACQLRKLCWVTVSADWGRAVVRADRHDTAAGETLAVHAFHREAERVEEITARIHTERTAEGVTVTWSVEPGTKGEVAVFAEFPVPGPDYDNLAAPAFIRELVVGVCRATDRPDGVWTDGVGLPALAERQTVFVGSSFRKEFKDRFGYTFAHHLPSLAWELPDSGKVRIDLASTRADMVFRVQSMLHTECRHRFGDGLNVGARNDGGVGAATELIRGTADRFRFSLATQTGGFTGGRFEDEPAMSWSVALARSLGKYHVHRYAANVSGGDKPTWEQVWHYTNLMCAQSVRWVASPEGGGGHFPGEWMRLVNEKFAWVGERTEFSFPEANVAVVYNWRCAAWFGDVLADQYLRSVQQLTHRLTERGVAFDVVSPDLVTTADDMTATGGFTRKEATYDALVYPWPVAHAPLDWEVLLGYVEDGGKAVLYGFAPETAGGAARAGTLGELLKCKLPGPESFARCREPIEFRGQAVPVRNGGLLAQLPVPDADVSTTGGRSLSVTNDTRTCWYLSYDAGFMTPDVFVPLLQGLGVRRLVESPGGTTATLVGDKLVCVGLWGRLLRGATFTAGGKSVTIDAPTDLAIVDLRTERVEPFPPPISFPGRCLS